MCIGYYLGESNSTRRSWPAFWLCFLLRAQHDCLLTGEVLKMSSQSNEKTLVASLCVGKDPYLSISQPIQRAYARKYGHAYHVIDTEQFRVRPNLFRKRWVGVHFEKFQLYELMNTYNRIIYLDADVIPTVDAPDLLSEVPEGSWGSTLEVRGAYDWKFKHELDRVARKLGELPVDSWRLYFNAGVLVFDRQHKAIWEWNPKHVLAGRWPEQTLLNYRILRSNTAVHELDDRYNYSPQRVPEWEDDTVRRSAFFIHYAGQPAKLFMQRDIAFFEEQWGLPD